MSDWQRWHDDYGDPHSSLSRRLPVVRRFLSEAVAGLHAESRILSLCAGDGRDVLPIIGAMPPEVRPRVFLIELDPGLADAARQLARAENVDATVLVADAGWTANWAAYVPADLLLLCGIFGNIPDHEVLTTINATPAMVRQGGAVIWTRAGDGSQSDLRPKVRTWFRESGMDEVAFDFEARGFGVGFNRYAASSPGLALPKRLFQFTNA